jgi:hypothetical protein
MSTHELVRPEGSDTTSNVAESVEDEVIQLSTGEMMDISRINIKDVDKIVLGYLSLAQVVGGDMAAELYKKANPNSRFNGEWFDRFRHRLAEQD